MHADQLVPAVVAAVAVVCLLIAGRAHGQDEYVPAGGGQASEEVEPQPAMPMPTNLLNRPFMPGGSLPGAFAGGYFPQQPTNEPEPETKEEPQPEPEPETKEEPQPEQREPEPVTPTRYQGDFYRTGVTPTIPEPRAMPTSPESWENFAAPYIPKNPYVPMQQNNGGGSYIGGGADNKQLDADGEPVDGLSQKAIDNILKEHNAFRAKEHVPPLTWNATVAQYAQHYANERKGDCALKHSTGPYGENLMYGQGKAWTWRHTVDEWSDEKKNYHYGSNTCDAGKMCGHYTAVVWKGTTAVGCGRVTCASGDTLMVCSYYPPGNYDGEKPY